MKIFDDKELTNEIEVLDFGIVEAGSSKIITLYLYNETKAVLSNIEFVFPPSLPEPERLTIEKISKTLQPGKSAEMILKWSPSMNFKQALEVPIIIKGDEIYLAEHHIQK